MNILKLGLTYGTGLLFTVMTTFFPLNGFTDENTLPQLPPLSPNANALLLTLEGSTTIGNILAPKIAHAYLEEKGLQNITTQSSVIGDGQTLFKIAGLSPQGKSHYIEITSNGSSSGFKSLKNQETDIAMSSRSIKDKEATDLEFLGYMRSIDSQHILAIDGLAVITHPNNPVNQLSVNDLAAIYMGKINNWKMLGGPDQNIIIFDHETSSGTYDTFKSIVLKKKKPASKEINVIHDLHQLSETIANTPFSIGYATISMIGNTKALSISETQEDLSIFPNTTTIASEEYPISRRLFLYSASKPTNPITTEFIQFAKSQKISPQIADSGFVPQRPIAIASDAPRVGPKAYLSLVEKAEKLSINFRFPYGSVSLSDRIEYDLNRVVAYIDQNQLQDKEIMLIGFGDRENQRKTHNLLSKLRAKKIKTVLEDHQIPMGEIAGFNAYTTTNTKGINQVMKKRRVEIWIR